MKNSAPPETRQGRGKLREPIFFKLACEVERSEIPLSEISCPERC